MATGSREGDFVLVVDDEPTVAEMATEALREAGYRALFALDAFAGMGQLESNKDIGLLFTDIVMPGIDGFRFADMATARRPWLKVLYTTGYMGLVRELQVAGELHGQILDKPYRPAALVAAVRRALD